MGFTKDTESGKGVWVRGFVFREVDEGGEEVELSQDTQLEEFRPIMELLADKQKPRKNLAKTQSADRHFPQCPVSFRYFQS